jgi:glycosyltransferase involved in cell wall biosynthesis
MFDAVVDGLPWILGLIHLGLWGVVIGNVWYVRRHRQRAAIDDFPLLTVLVPARNEADNLQRLLPSLLEQDHPAFEVIVYDDGSDDATWDILQTADDPRLKALRGDGPPPGWVGKVHALYQASRHATGDRYLFLDADAALNDAGALRRLAERFAALPPDAVLTGLTRLRGQGGLLVSLVPNAILVGLPWPLVQRVRSHQLSALNGQCWMIDAEDYHRHEPHQALPNEVLEDVMIGRYLKREGLLPVLVDVQREVSIHMYDSVRSAWRGFRKNAYLILGGAPLPFVALFLYFMAIFVIAPWLSPWLLASVYGLKATTDRLSGFPWWITLLAPLSYVLGNILQLDSAISHWTRRVEWKGRRVGA